MNENSNHINDYGNLAICIVKKSANICKRIYQKKVCASQRATLNSHKDIANQNASKIILALLKKSYPHHKIIDDMSLKMRSNDLHFIKPVWIIDYLDGGKNFDNGIPFFCSSVALYSENVCQVAAIYDPLHDELFYYQKDLGSFLNGKLIKEAIKQTSSRKRRKEIISVAWASYSHPRDYQLNEKIYNIVTKSFNQQRRLGSVALDLCYMALGRFGGMYCYNVNFIDIAAGLPISIGVGGYDARNFLGDQFTFEDQNIVVAHKSIINHLSASIKTVYTSLFDDVTSITHPFYMDIFPPLLTGGVKLAISAAPGIQCNGALFNQKRELVTDLKIIKQKGIKIIISLLKENEYECCNINNLFVEAANLGLKTIHFPIVDRSIPKNKKSVFDLCQKVNKLLQKKEGIMIHCLGGFGRSATVAACLLLYRQPFISVNYLIDVIRTIKGGALTELKQVKFVHDFGSWLQKHKE